MGDYGHLYATFAASMEVLDKKTSEERFGFSSKFSFAEMHRRLCVLQKQAVVPNTMLMHLWGAESKESAELIGMVFVEVGLASQETIQGSERESGFTLHDSVHEFAVSEARRHGEVMDAHNMLLEGYGSECEYSFCESVNKKVKWWSRGLRDDGYIHKELCRHLVGSGRKEELCELLLMPLWAERQIEVNGVMCVEDDFRIGVKEIGEGEETEEAMRLIADAVRLSSSFVMRNRAELWFQLHGRLKGCAEGNREIEKYVKWIETYAPKPRVVSTKGFLMGAGGRNTKLFSVGRGGVSCMALFPDEERVACGCADGSAVVLNIRRSEIERKWKVDESRIWSIGVAKDGTRVVTLSSDSPKLLNVWNVESGIRVWRYSGRLESPTYFAATHDERYVVSVSRGRILHSWDLETGERVVPPINVGPGVKCFTLLKDGERAITGHQDGKLRIWNIRTGAQIGEIDNSKGVVTCVTVTPDERNVVSLLRHSFRRSRMTRAERNVVSLSHPSFRGSRVTLWDLETRQKIWISQAEAHTSSWSVFELTKDGSRIICGDISGAIHVLDMKSGDQVCDPLGGHAARVSGVSFLENKNSVVSSSEDGTVRVWDIVRRENGTSLIPLRHWGLCSSFSFTPDGKFVVHASGGCELQIWDVSSGQTMGRPLVGHSGSVTGIVVTPDGRFIVSVSYDNTVRVWDLESLSLLHTFTGHTDRVWCVAVTPKGDRVVTGSGDRTVRVWDLTRMDGSHVAFEGHSDAVMCVFVSDDGLRVTSVDVKNNVFVWSIESRDVRGRAVVDGASEMSREEVFSLIGEDSIHDGAGLSIPLDSNEIIHGQGSEARVLATLESNVRSWGISPDKTTICLALRSGQVGFLKVDV